MSSIYRAYDIRGVFGEDLTIAEAEKIGKAFGSYIKSGKIVVGYDGRLSSPALRDSLIKGLASTGCDVLDVGMVPTPVLYFSIIQTGRDGGVMITGSHNAPKYNGFKMCTGWSTLYGEQIQDIRKAVEKGDFKTGKGKVSQKNIVEEYSSEVKKRIKLKKKIKVVVDGGNGVGGKIASKILRDLGCEVVELYCEPDGNFPNHFPDPTVDGNLVDLKATVIRERADLGIAFDGDADRLGVVDDEGRIIRGDQTLIIFARDVLKKMKGAKIIFEVKCSQAVIDEVKKNGGIPIMYRTGHSFIKKKMKEENSPLAGEMSGHFFIADNYYGFDDGIYSGARIIQILSNSDQKLSEMIDSQPKYYSTPEIRVHCPETEKFKVVAEITKKFQDKKEDVITVDGARIQYKDGWGLVRASNTEPALILRFEAKTQERLNEIEKTIKKELQQIPCIKNEIK